MLKYTDKLGRKVNLVKIGERSNLPVFDFEVVNNDGEVVDHGEILGHTALTMEAVKRGWIVCG